MLAWAKQASTRLAELEGDDDRIAGLADEEASLAAEVGQLAGELSAPPGKRRRTSSPPTSRAELTALAMPHARLTVAVTPLSEPGPHGADDIEIRLAAHPGAPALPLHKGASGGELSRVMLAIEVVFAGADPVPTFVFDEVDAGVGGKAAVEVGRRLARLARLAQVIVVTHLPQVAAFADTHLVVEKADDGSVTRSGVTRLDRRGGSGSCPGCWPAWRTPSSAGPTRRNCSRPRRPSGPPAAGASRLANCGYAVKLLMIAVRDRTCVLRQPAESGKLTVR